jgi:SAM-dependent methyltransferase
MMPTTTRNDGELKVKHRKMWASGDYPSMVETFLLPLGPRLVEASGIGPGMKVLDVAAGTGNASLPAARLGARVTASDLTPELLVAGSERARADELELDWVEADAENLPFEDGSFDVVISAIGVMFAPMHERAAAELVRVTRRGGRIGVLSWTPEGMIGALFGAMKPFMPPPPPGAGPPPLWGSEDHLRGLLGPEVALRSVERDVLEVMVFERPKEFAEHFRDRYGPTIAARTNAESNGRKAELDSVLDDLVAEWNRGEAERARFEIEYLLAVGERTG